MATKKATTEGKKTPKTSTGTKTKVNIKATKKQPLVHAQGEQCFWVADGRVLANLCDLNDTLGSIHEDVFYHHVGEDKNDFAEWVAHILNDHALADSLRKSTKPQAAQKVVKARLQFYSV
jgi:hypothetical protein